MNGNIGNMGPGIAQGIERGLSNVANIRTQTRREQVQAEDRAYKRSMQEQQLGMQEQQQAQTTEYQDMQMQVMQQKLDDLENKDLKNTTYNAFRAYTESGDTKYINQALKENPRLQAVHGAIRVEKLNPNEDKNLIARLGDEGKDFDPNRYLKAYSPDGNVELIDMNALYAQTGYLQQVDDEKLKKLLVQAKIKKAEQAPTEMTPFDIKTAEYFGAIKTKMDEGTATDAEKATYSSWLTSKSGTAGAQSEKVSADISKLEKKGVDLNSPDFDINKLDTKKKQEAQTAIRNLENTTAGRALVKNISAKLGDGVGAVTETSKELSRLATMHNVSTNVVQETTDKVKSYLPETLRVMGTEDLKSAKFRQAYLSATAVFLKLQSGLTVSDKEAARFESSFGTLSKNIKVNMIGLKTKLDEVIGDYEANATIEPTLYNAKYRGPVARMKQISSSLDKFIETKPQEITPTTKTNKVSVGQTIYDKQGNAYKLDESGKPVRITE